MISFDIFNFQNIGNWKTANFLTWSLTKTIKDDGYKTGSNLSQKTFSQNKDKVSQNLSN